MQAGRSPEVVCIRFLGMYEKLTKQVVASTVYTGVYIPRSVGKLTLTIPRTLEVSTFSYLYLVYFLRQRTLK